MGAVTGTVAGNAALSAGGHKIITITATLGAASDVITLTAATHGIRAITGLLGAVITSGLAGTFGDIQVSRSGLELTVVSKNITGAAATTFGTIEIGLIGTLAS